MGVVIGECLVLLRRDVPADTSYSSIKAPMPSNKLGHRLIQGQHRFGP